MKYSRENRILSEGKIDFPEYPEFVPSECYALQGKSEFVISTLGQSPTGKMAPCFSLLWESQTQELVKSETIKNLSLRMAHARNLSISPNSDFFIITDHGFDALPFAGGHSKIIQRSNQEWCSVDLFKVPGFHFDVTIGQNLVVMTNLQSLKQTCLSLDQASHLISLDNVWPEGLCHTKWLTALFVDFNNDGREELVIGGRGGSERDLIFRWDDSKFLHSDMILPVKQNAHWETVLIKAVDMNGDGRKDLITLNHNENFSQGNLEIYLNYVEGFKTMEMDEHLLQSFKATNRWLHRVDHYDFSGKGFPDLVFTVRKKEHQIKNSESSLFFAINQMGKRLEYGAYDLFQNEDNIFATWLDDFNLDGRAELLSIRYNGKWTLSTINQFGD